MKKVRITVKRIVRHDDLIAEYENPIEHACEMKLGQVFVCNGWGARTASATARGIQCRRSCWRWRTAERICTTAG